MNETSMPFEAYFFVGITALLLSYVTIMETPSTQQGPESESATSMLPSFMTPSTNEQAPPMLPPVVAPSLAPESSGSVFSNFQSNIVEPTNNFSGNQPEETTSIFPSFTGEQPPQPQQPRIMGGKKNVKKLTKKYKKANKKTRAKR